MDVQSQKKLKTTVGIVILNWNNYEDTKECLQSIIKQSYEKYEVVIVDGKSTDDSTKRIQKDFPFFHYIYSKSDSGYSGGNNIGIKYFLKKETDFILSMNNDVILTKNCLRELVAGLKNNSNAGIVGPRMYSYFDRSIFQISGGYVNIFKSKPLPKWVKEGDIDSREPFLVNKLPGACLLVRSSIIKKVGLMDEGFFLYYADTDWQKRISNRGWLQVSISSAKAFHKVSASVGSNSIKLLYYDSRDFLFYVKKHSNIVALIYCLTKSWISKNLNLLTTKDKDKLIKLKYINMAYAHFFMGVRGRAI